MFRKKREEEARLAAERKEKASATRTANNKLRAEIKDLKLQLETQKDEHGKVLRANTRGMTKKDEAIVELQETIEILQELENNRVKQQVDAIELEAREKLVEAREKQFKSFEKELKEAKTEAEKLGEERYKTGYSDGLADGLRKIHEITAEDRKMSMQVALVAASSHTPGAAKEIAKKVSTDMLLGSGTDSDEDDSED